MIFHCYYSDCGGLANLQQTNFINKILSDFTFGSKLFYKFLEKSSLENEKGEKEENLFSEVETLKAVSDI